MSETSGPLGVAAARALALMSAAGFDQARVSVGEARVDELSIAHNEPSLLRTTETRQVTLVGVVGARMASTEVADTSEAALRECIGALFDDAKAAPEDPAHTVSSGQRAVIVQGPQRPDFDLLAAKAVELLEFRLRETPRMMIDEGEVKHTLRRWHTLTSAGSDIACSVGCYSIGAFGTAREGGRSSSFNYAGGSADDLDERHAAEWFGIGEMLCDTVRQIETSPFAGKFVGDVVLTPPAVATLLGWLLEQLADTALISASSVYRERVGEAIASPLFALHSRFDAPGVAPLSADAFLAPPLEVVRAGRLLTLTPSRYGANRTGLPHVPVASAGWDIPAGQTPLAQLTQDVTRGAIVGRLSMGRPATNGDFSGVIKNSFAVEGGVAGQALSETMIAGNMAQMLHDIVAVSRERIDSGAQRLPWMRIGGLHFS